MDFYKAIDLEKLTPELCFQCNRCSSGCPTAYYMDYKPAQIIHLLRMDQTEKVLQSEAIWYCVLCETCTARCPQGVDIAQVMTSAKGLANKAGIIPQSKEILWFNNAFTKNVKRNGRLNELTFIISLKLKTRDFSSDRELGINMLKLGKLPFLQLPKGTLTTRKLFKKSRKIKD